MRRTLARSAAVLFLLMFPLGSEAGILTWTTGGPLGGWVRKIVFDPKTPGVVYAATSGGVFKSTNGGVTWQRMNTGLGVTFVEGLAIDASNPSTLAAVTGPLSANPTVGGVFVTTNGGLTWQQKTSGMSGLLTGWSVAIDPVQSGVMYAGTFAGIYRTANGGANWLPINSGLTNTFIDSIAVDPVTPTRVYVGTHGGFFASDNSGTAWYLSTSGMAAPPLAQAIAIDRQNPSTLYSAANFTTDNLYRSTDRGATWSAFNTGLPNQGFGAIYDIDAGPTGIFAAMIGVGIFQNGTSISGSQWYNNTNGLSPPFNCYTVAADPFGTRVFGSDDGVLVNTSVITGGQWVPINTGLTAHNVSTVAVDPHNPTTVYAGTIDRAFYMSTDGGLTWSANSSGFNPFWGPIFSIAVDPTTPSTLYAGTGSDVFKSINGGQTWTQSATGMLPAFIDYVYSVTIDPTNSNVIYATRVDGVYKSINAAANWTQTNTGISQQSLLSGMRAVAVDPRNSSVVYVGAGDGGVYKSTNGGASWTSITGSLPANRQVQTIAIDPVDTSNVYIGMEANVNLGKGGVFVTRNSGASWSNLANGLTVNDVTSLIFDPLVPSIIYAGTRGGGVFISTNRGQAWNPFNNGSPNMFVSGLAIGTTTPIPFLPFIHARQLYAGTEGSVYSLSY